MRSPFVPLIALAAVALVFVLSFLLTKPVTSLRCALLHAAAGETTQPECLAELVGAPLKLFPARPAKP